MKAALCMRGGLEVRLHELDGVVEKWILLESAETFSGQRKPLWWWDFGRHEPRFAPYLSRPLTGGLGGVG